VLHGVLASNSGSLTLCCKQIQNRTLHSCCDTARSQTFKQERQQLLVLLLTDGGGLHGPALLSHAQPADGWRCPGEGNRQLMVPEHMQDSASHGIMDRACSLQQCSKFQL